MNGSINFDGTLSGSIARGGGGGGSEVTITPVLTEGTKIADYTVDSSSGSLYAPEAGDTVEVTPTLNVGDKVADIAVNGVNKALYSQSYAYANDMHDTNSETIGGLQKGSNITPIMVKAVSYADQSGVDGETIGVLSVGDTDYAVKQKKASMINYSTTEQDTGQKWIDDSPIYQISFEESFSQGWTKTISNDSIKVVSIEAYAIYETSGVLQYIQLPYYYTNNDRCLIYVRNGVVAVDSVASFFQSYTKISCTIQYVKVV